MPVDVQPLEDGSMSVSDDLKGFISGSAMLVSDASKAGLNSAILFPFPRYHR